MKTKRCPRGTIRRKAYTRSSSSGKQARVASACIKDVGLPGKGFKGKGPFLLPQGVAKRAVPLAATPMGVAAKGPGIGELKEGELSRFGYDKVVTMSAKDRHAALTKAVNEYGALTVFRKLNAISVYTRHTAPESSRIFLLDRNWVKRTFGNTKND